MISFYSETDRSKKDKDAFSDCIILCEWLEKN